MTGISRRFTTLVATICLAGCATSEPHASGPPPFAPSAVIDLGAVVTEDLPQRFWGKAFMKQMGFTKQNAFDVIKWTFPMQGGSISGSNGYYTLFNHGGPHVDAPNHMGEGGGLDSYSVEAFSGRVKAFDASGYGLGRSIPVGVFKDRVEPGDIVLILTKYTPPEGDHALPDVKALTNDAAEFLAKVPVRAFGTDAYSVDAVTDTAWPNIHHAFLSRGIPVYEQLLNVGQLLGKQNMFFVGVPLNIKGGDGMVVRPVVFVY
jgi:kynurenine formamidase